MGIDKEIKTFSNNAPLPNFSHFSIPPTEGTVRLNKLIKDLENYCEELRMTSRQITEERGRPDREAERIEKVIIRLSQLIMGYK